MKKSQLLFSLKQQGFSNQIINAFSKVKRENFIPKELKENAYEDTALSIGMRQTISQPYTIAMMLSLLELKTGQKVLEIGSGCGYVLALLSEIIGDKGKVFGIELIKELAEHSRINLKARNIKVYHKNGVDGLEENSPYDRILISAGVENKVPDKILHQLKNKGILVAPIGSRYEQSLVVIQRNKDNFIIKEKIPGFVFVPFIE